MARKKNLTNSARGGKGTRRGGYASSYPLQNTTASGSRTNGQVAPTNNSQLAGTIPTITVSEVPPNRRQTLDQVRGAGSNSLTPTPRPSRFVGRPNQALAMTTPQLLKAYTRGADQLNKKLPPPRYFVTMYVTMPGPMRGFKDVDPSDVDIKTIFERIAEEHQAKVDMDEDGSTIIIKATNRGKAEEVIKAIRKQLLYHAGEESVWRNQMLVHPPKGGKGQFKMVLRPKAGGNGMRAVGVSPKDSADTSPDELAANMAGYKEKLKRALDQKVAILRHVPNRMEMRVQFGDLLFQQWKKDHPTYNFAEFGSLVSRAASRGTATMANMVSKSAVETLMAELLAVDGGVPQKIRSWIDHDTKPEFCIALETKNLHVESVLEPVKAQGRLGKDASAIQQYTLGPLKVHQIEKQHRSVAITTLCPDSSYDWEIEIRKLPAGENAKVAAPFTPSDLEKQLKFGGNNLTGNFPNFSIMKQFMRAHEIERVHGRATWTYALGGWYTMQVNLIHAWGKDTSVPPVTTGRVLLYGSDWDEDMRGDVMPPREWDSEFTRQFCQRDLKYPAPGNYDDSLSHFLAWVHWIQQALDKAPKETGKDM